LGHVPGPAPEIADGPPVVQERKEGEQLRAPPEELAAQPVPFAGSRREELLRPRPAQREDRLDPARVLLRDLQPRELLPDQTPEPPRRRVEARLDQTVETTRAVRTHGDPPLVGQDLEVTADRRLRELEHRTQLAHRQLVTLEDAEEPRPRRVGQRRQPVEDRHLRLHTIRPAGWKVAGGTGGVKRAETRRHAGRLGAGRSAWPSMARRAVARCTSVSMSGRRAVRRPSAGRNAQTR